MDFGYVGEQLTFVTRSRDFLIGCMFFFFVFYSSAHAIHPLFDSRLLIDCQCFFEESRPGFLEGWSSNDTYTAPVEFQ